jgi:hypothetical protein
MKLSNMKLGDVQKAAELQQEIEVCAKRLAAIDKPTRLNHIGLTLWENGPGAYHGLFDAEIPADSDAGRAIIAAIRQHLEAECARLEGEIRALGFEL